MNISRRHALASLVAITVLAAPAAATAANRGPATAGSDRGGHPGTSRNSTSTVNPPSA